MEIIGTHRTGTDHPRSRGVYIKSGADTLWSGGSSPLARGLPRSGPARPSPWRIIPARAGFTRRRMETSHPLPDHPRSRGVYTFVNGITDKYLGSSPLARGLRRDPGVRRGTATDHPRSRGVYFCLRAPASDVTGSSPLARGLRAHELAAWQRVRIIPARAGFTRRADRSRSVRADHPRSRGVYAGALRVGPGPGGSSPLARGLLRGEEHGRVRRGIIPARAGFTTGRSTTPPCTWDHPRSRGVYPRSRSTSSSRRGSSPLARGLRPPPRTRTRPALDHPRSRGVYREK